MIIDLLYFAGVTFVARSVAKAAIGDLGFWTSATVGVLSVVGAVMLRRLLLHWAGKDSGLRIENAVRLEATSSALDLLDEAMLLGRVQIVNLLCDSQ